MRLKSVAIFSGGFVAGIAFMIVLFAAVMPALNRYAQGKVEENLEPPILPTADADFEWKLTGLDGSEASLEQFRGITTVMTIWNPDCANCLAELPYLQILSDKMRDENVAFVGVSTRQKDNMQEILDEKGVSFPVYTYPDKDAIPEIYRVNAVPFTFVISPQGKVVLRYRGAARWDDDSFVLYLRELNLMATSELDTKETATEQ